MANCDVIEHSMQDCDAFLDRLNNGIQGITGIHPSRITDRPKKLKTREDVLTALTLDLHENINEAGEEYAYHPDIPQSRLHGLQYVMVQDYGHMLTAETAEHININTLISMYRKAKSLMKKQKDLSVTDRTFGDVLRTMIKRDKSGLMAKYIEQTLSLSDNASSAHEALTRKHMTSANLLNTHIRLVLEEMPKSIDEIMVGEGLTGVRDDDGRLVTIVSALEDGTFRVKDDLTEETRIKKLEDLSIRNGSDLQNATYKTYFKFMSELLMGRSRYIEAAVIPIRKNAQGFETSEFKNFRKTEDWKKIERQIEEFKKYGEKGLSYPFAYTVSHKGTEYTYIMIKNGEGIAPRKEPSVKKSKGVPHLPPGETHETYRAYLIAKKTAKGKEYLKDTGYTQEWANEVLPTGFYRGQKSQHTRAVSDHRDTNLDIYNITEWQNFQHMKHQPDNDIIDGTAKGVQEELPPINIWEAVSQYRHLLREIFVDVHNRLKIEDSRLEELEHKLRMQYGRDLDSFLEMVEEVSGFKNTVWRDEGGNLHTPASFMRTKGINYFPMLFHDQDARNDIKAAISMVEDKITALEDDIAIEEDEDVIEDIQEELLDKKAMLQGVVDSYLISIGKDQDIEKKDSILARSVYSKNRGTIMDYTKSRTDPQTIEQYIGRIYRALEINKLKYNLLQVLPLIPKQEIHRVILVNNVFDIVVENGKVVSSEYKQFIGKPITAVKANVKRLRGEIKLHDIESTMYDHLINRTKVTLSDPTAQGGLFPNTRIAGWINKFRSKDHVQITPQAVQDVIISVNSFAASFFLASPGATAAINNTQRVNPLAVFGGEVFSEAMQLESDPVWQDRTQHAGVRNIVNIFNEILLGSVGDETTIRDFLFLPFVKFPGKGIFDWNKLRQLGRTSFIEKGDSTFNNLLGKMLDKRTEKEISTLVKEGKITRAQAEEMMQSAHPSAISKKLDKLYKEAKGQRAETLRRMRQAYWDILFKTDKTSVEDLQQEFKILVGSARSDVVKRGVSACMSWWFNELGTIPGKGFFTMAESEKKMRTQTAIAHLLIADRMGHLGESKDRFKSEKAIFIARAGVYAHMFGMSQAMLPDLWAGGGRTMGQFKGYAYNQIKRDFQIMDNYFKSTRGKNVLARIATGAGRFAWQTVKGVTYPFRKLVHNMAYGRSDMKKSGESWSKEDRMAQQIAYMTHTRIFATLYHSLVWEFGAPGLGAILRKMRTGMYLHGAENPLFGLVFRTLLYTLAYGGADDEDRIMKGWQRLLLPPLISYMIEKTMSQYYKHF